MDDRPNNCGKVCYAWHKNTAREKYNNPRKMIRAYEAVSRTPKYIACCSPDRPLNLMNDLSQARDRARYGH